MRIVFSVAVCVRVWVVRDVHGVAGLSVFEHGVWRSVIVVSDAGGSDGSFECESECESVCGTVRVSERSPERVSKYVTECESECESVCGTVRVSIGSSVRVSEHFPVYESERKSKFDSERESERSSLGAGDRKEQLLVVVGVWVVAVGAELCGVEFRHAERDAERAHAGAVDVSW